jgi:hypothetical protein
VQRFVSRYNGKTTLAEVADTSVGDAKRFNIGHGQTAKAPHTPRCLAQILAACIYKPQVHPAIAFVACVDGELATEHAIILTGMIIPIRTMSFGIVEDGLFSRLIELIWFQCPCL